MSRDEMRLRARLLVASLSLAWLVDQAPAGLFKLGAFLTTCALFVAVWAPWGKPERDD